MTANSIGFYVISFHLMHGFLADSFSSMNFINLSHPARSEALERLGCRES
jgi:hypothetical protein